MEMVSKFKLGDIVRLTGSPIKRVVECINWRCADYEKLPSGNVKLRVEFEYSLTGSGLHDWHDEDQLVSVA